MLMALLPMMSLAQQRFGYVSYTLLADSMPDGIVARHQMNNLRAQYQNEMKRAEDEFNKKYEEFVQLQNSLATPIRMKRQAELQEMMEKNIAFKEEAQRLLQKAEQEAMAPVLARLNEAIHQVGAERGYAFILNTDGNAVPYIDPLLGEDITELVLQRLAP